MQNKEETEGEEDIIIKDGQSNQDGPVVNENQNQNPIPVQQNPQDDNQE